MKYQISKLESGKTYNLSQIFSRNFSIAIPDLQRDYCWGLETYDKKGNKQGELVSSFLVSLKESWQERLESDQFMPMGLIYGYEWPKGTYQLCDGQQRITTFYLLAGELYRSNLVSPEVKSDLKDILIKENYSLVGDDECITSGLQYSIRETTLYFLSDLVSKYFCSRSPDLKFYNLTEREENHLVLKPDGRPSWYFLEYDHDTTIQSMLGAIDTIRKFLTDSFGEDEESISSFAKAVATQFSFIYYDMGNRMRGEETFVILNTSGEPLTATENLKPLLINVLTDDPGDEGIMISISQQWEDREDWFWRHKSGKELTSDELSRDFYTWWLLTYGGKDSVNLIKDFFNPKLSKRFKEIHSFFESLKEIISWIFNSDEAISILSKVARWTSEIIDCSSESSILSWLREPSHRELILPLLLFHTTFGNDGILSLLRRISKNYYIGKTTKGIDDQENLRPYVKFRDIINLIIESHTPSDVLESPLWFNYDEQQKEKIFNDNFTDLLEIELHDNLRFDLNVLWNSGVDTVDKAKNITTRLAELQKLSEGQIIEDVDERIAISMSNKYRLLRFLKHWGAPSGKQDNLSWSKWGIRFTQDKYIENLIYSYGNNLFCKLLTTKNLPLELEMILRNTIYNLNKTEGIFSNRSLSHPEGIMRAWLISKFLLNDALESPKLISSYNERFFVDKDSLDENKINKNSPITIGNICLHYATKFSIWRANEHNYNDPTLLDSPLFAGLYDVGYELFNSGNVPEDIINETTNHILNLFQNYIQ